MSSAAALAKAATPLEQLLEEINFQRTKEMRQMLKDDSGFIMVHGTTYWTDLFVRHFLFQTDRNIDCDDLLFFVRKKHIKSSSRLLPKFETEVDVFRKASRKLPIGDPDMDWEETVYLNLIIHQFDYTLTLAICTRTSPKELQVLRRHSQKVYASPSRRRMDTKAEVEEMTYPNVCFMVDNFNEVFSDIMVRDGEMVCVELVASDRDGAIQGVIFLGSIRYDALKRVYDARSSLSSKMAQRMTFGLFSNSSSQRVEFVRMKGPQGKGHAEMAVTKPKGYSGAETPTSEPGYCATDMWDSDWDSDPEEFFAYRHQRRLSDPSANINNFVRGGWKTKPSDTAGSKARSENEGLDSLANGLNEIEAGDLRDDCEFCVHSASITTSDASIPLGTSSTVTKATSSSASTSSSTLLKRLPPASSIISSFFPSCKSKHSGQAVPCTPQIIETEVQEDSDRGKADNALLNVPEGSSACVIPTSAAQCEVSKCECSAPVSIKSDNQDLINSADTVVTGVEHIPKNCKGENKLRSALEETIESDVIEEEDEGSEDEFEDCNSVVSDVGGQLLSHHSNHSGKENVESESQEDAWSDAEGDISEANDALNLLDSQLDVTDKDCERECKSSSDDWKSGQYIFDIERDKERNCCMSLNENFKGNNRNSQRCNEGKLNENEVNEIFHSFEERSISMPIKTMCKDSPFETGNAGQTVIESCKEETFQSDESSVSKNTIGEDKKTDFDVCAHGVAMSNLCLLCLGYSKNEPVHKTYNIFRMKSGYKNRGSVQETNEGTIRKTAYLQSSAKSTPRKKKIGSEQNNQSQSPTITCGTMSEEGGHQIPKLSQTLPRRRKSESNVRQKRDIAPPQKTLPDGTVIYYWCDVPGGFNEKSPNELDDGAYNPLWTMRGFTQTFHFWKENKRAQSVPLNAFLTYVTLPWWSIVKDILDHRESPILTF